MGFSDVFLLFFSNYVDFCAISQASDQGTTVKSSTVTLTVNVLDINDGVPTFTGKPPYSAIVNENELPGTKVCAAM